MTWGEAIRLMRILRRDPSSQFAASMEGWDQPVAPEWAVLADLFDAFVKTKFKKPKPYPRPWDKDGKRVQRHGNTGGRTRAEVVAILNDVSGHSLPV